MRSMLAPIRADTAAAQHDDVEFQDMLRLKITGKVDRRSELLDDAPSAIGPFQDTTGTYRS